LKFTRGDTIVSFEKMWFLQKKHALRYASTSSDNHSSTPKHDLNIIAGKPVTERLERLMKHGWNLDFYSTIPEQQRRQLVSALVKADAQNYTSASEFVDRNISFFQTPTAKMLNEGRGKIIKAAKLLPDTYNFENFHSKLDAFQHLGVDAWEVEKLRICIENVIKDSVESADESISESCTEAKASTSKVSSTFVHTYLRWATSAGQPGPDGALTMSLLGKKETLKRLSIVKDRLDSALESSVGSGK
jgi:glutamyl-tRNA synthetase